MTSYLVYPCMMGGVVGATLLLLGTGLDAPLITGVVAVAASVAMMVLERTRTYEPAWRLSRGDVGVDVAFTLAFTGTVPLLVRALCFGALTAAAAKLASWAPFPLWPSRAPLLVQLALALLVAELPQYWVHRLGHTARPLWRVHAMHHSVRRLYFLNAGRFHPFDTLLQYSSEVVPLVLLGAGPELLALYTTFTAANGAMRHANIEQRAGLLGWIFSTAELHRWHHSHDPVEANANYGANLIVWDVVFGTRRAPEGRAHPDQLGLGESPDFPTDFVGQLASPLALQRYERQLGA